MNLTDYIKKVSIEDFGLVFQHQAVFNKRLKTTGGRFFPHDGHIDFNPLLFERYSEEIYRKVVRHELCHYHLYFQGKGFKHKDKDFKTLLKEVDGLRFCPPLHDHKKDLEYFCQYCGQIYFRKRRLDTKRFVCGKCRGKLILKSRKLS